MKCIKYIIFVLFIFLINIFYVYASCTDGELSELKEKSNEIKITYKHLGLVEDSLGMMSYSSFSVTVKNVSEDLFLSIFDVDDSKFYPTDGIIKMTLDSGKWNLKVYSSKCEELIDEISFELPTFNIYSLDPLCEGINGDDFALCGKYYEYYVSYDDFVTRVNNYRSTHDVSNIEVNSNNTESILNKIIDFVLEYKIYFIMVFGFVLLLLLIILFVRRSKKRGVLK